MLHLRHLDWPHLGFRKILEEFWDNPLNPSIGSSGISFLGFHADADPPKLSIYPMGRYLKMNRIVSDYHFPVYETPC